ncbi:hypothetical protein I4U23_003710 [Adineta vaga]|nr:hypothetical protein I4U23_003710 [Adineta vaga]
MWQKIIFIVCVYEVIVQCKIITPDDASLLQSTSMCAHHNGKLDSVTLAPGIYHIPFNDHQSIL